MYGRHARVERERCDRGRNDLRLPPVRGMGRAREALDTFEGRAATVRGDVELRGTASCDDDCVIRWFEIVTRTRSRFVVSQRSIFLTRWAHMHGSYLRSNSCSQMRRTRQPIFRNVRFTRRSRARLAASLVCQNS